MNDKETFVFGGFRLSAGRRELSAQGAAVHLGSRAFDLLLALVRRRGNLVTKDELMAEVWPGTVVEESNLQVQISALRKALGEDPQGAHYLVTVPSRGYRFVAAVELAEPTPTVAAERPGPTERAGPGAAALPLPEKASIAVLPFANMSGDPEQDYFADGMAEEILTALARCGGLFVIARNSSFVYKGNAVDIRQVGRELGVRYVLEGSVRRGGNRLRFTSQLIDAISGAHIWADRFDGELGDVFDLQDRITQNVVAAIEPNIELAEIERLKHRTAANLSAYDHLLRARQLEYEFTEQSLDAALRHLQEAIRIDPSYAPALAFAACCYGWRQTQGWASDVAAETAEGLRLRSRALELDRFDASVLWMSAVATWHLGQEGNTARELAYRSLEVNPNSAMALTIAGRVEAFSGNYAKGRELLILAQRLSPRDPRAWFALQGMSVVCLGEGQFEEGVAWARKALAQNPRFANATRILAVHLAHLGQFGAAREAAAESLRIDPDFTISKFRSRRRFLDDKFWQAFSQGMRLAGLPE